MQMKAFSCLELDEWTGGIYFAEHRIAAHKAGANAYGDGELSYVQCRRATWADRYAETGVPARIAVAHGWRFECFGCGMNINEDEMLERKLPLYDICGLMSSRIYCSPRCKWRAMKENERRKCEEQAAIEDFKAIVLRRFPDADFNVTQDNFNGHHAYVDREPGTGSWNRKQVIVSFKFPGMKFGPATFRMDGTQGELPTKADYFCCSGDQEAFEEWAAFTKSPIPHKDKDDE